MGSKYTGDGAWPASSALLSAINPRDDPGCRPLIVLSGPGSPMPVLQPGRGHRGHMSSGQPPPITSDSLCLSCQSWLQLRTEVVSDNLLQVVSQPSPLSLAMSLWSRDTARSVTDDGSWSRYTEGPGWPSLIMAQWPGIIRNCLVTTGNITEPGGGQ